MSIKDIHLIFVTVSVLLSGFFGYWSYGQYQLTGHSIFMIATGVSVLMAVGLIIYGISFYKKIKTHHL